MFKVRLIHETSFDDKRSVPQGKPLASFAALFLPPISPVFFLFLYLLDKEQKKEGLRRRLANHRERAAQGARSGTVLIRFKATLKNNYVLKVEFLNVQEFAIIMGEMSKCRIFRGSP